MSSSRSWSSSDGDSNDHAALWWSDDSDAANSVTDEANANAATPCHCTEEDRPAADGVAGRVEDVGRLEPRERIHRYIDQCIPPALMSHQRSADGPLLVQLCAELEAFGTPKAWTNHVPATVFDEYAATVEKDARGSEATHPHSAAPELGPRADLFEAALYSCENVAYPSHPSLAELRRAAGCDSGATVPWSTLTRHLSYLSVRLHGVLSAPHGCFGAYVLPLRLQASVVPLLYAWATHWPLIEADIECWRAVVRCFYAACRPPSPDKASSDANVEAALRSTFTLPWQPLAALCLSARDKRNAELPSWRSTLTAIVTSLPSLCRRASPHFSAAAVDGLWGLVAGQLAPTEDGVAALSLFVRLVPYRHLCQPKTDVVVTHGAIENEAITSTGENNRGSHRQQESELASTTAAAAPPQLTARAKQILRFLLVETATWQPPGRPSPAVAPSGAKGRKSKASARGFYLTWEKAVMTFAGSLARAHPGVAGMDAFAEPLFTAWLQALQLPAGSGAGLPGASATSAAAVSHLMRKGGHEANSPTGLNTARGGPEASSRAISWTAAPYVRLLNGFPDTGDSPLWRHLERWLHATSVLVRPGMPCTKGSAADRVCDCYSSLAREAVRRCAPNEKRAAPKRQASRGAAVVEGPDTQASAPPDDAAAESTAAQAARRWGPATAERFVSLLLPHAVAAFQARARQAQPLLWALLRLSPATVLPDFLNCVRTGLRSPTEVAAQRAVSTRLLTGAVPTILVDAEAASLLPSNTSSATLLAFLRETLPSMLTFVNPSDVVSALPVLSLVAVATSYAGAEEVFGTVDEVDAFAKAYVARVLPLFAANADVKDGHFPNAEVMVRAFLRTLPSTALSMVTREVLREAQSRDHGARMAGLVRMVAACAPAEAWAWAQKHWLRVLLDTSARDAEVEWAAPLLAACVADLGDRSLARAHATSIWRGVQLQLRILTSKKRRTAGAQVMEALMASLMRPRERSETHLRISSGEQLRLQQLQATATAPGSTRVPGSATELPLSRIGTATEARVYVEWPGAEDVQVAVDLFNASLQDCVHVIEEVSGGAVLNTAAAGATVAVSSDGDISLHAQFFAAASTATAAPSSGADAVLCESAAAVTRHSVLEGTLHWMQRLLCACEWVFIEPTPTATAADPQQTRGVPWWDVDPHVPWRPTGAPLLPASCRPAYTRAEVFEVLRRCVCLPMLRQHVVVPLRQCGVELKEWFGAPSGEEVPTSADDSQAAVVELLRLLQWLSSSIVRLPQQRWRPAASLSHYLRRIIGRQCPWVRRRLPLGCWVDRSLQLQVEAVAHGHLPVTQKTFSDVVSVVQSLCLSPRRPVWGGAMRLLVHVRLFGALDSASLAMFEGRVRAVAADIVCQWRAGVASAASDTAVTKAALRPQEQRRLLPATTTAAVESPGDGNGRAGQPLARSTPAVIGVAPSATLRLHTLQGAMEGVQTLLMSLALNREFFEAPTTCMESLRFLVRFPEELRSVTAGLLLPQFTERVRSAKVLLITGAARSPAFTEELVQVAYELAATYPARAVLLLAYAHLVYWPSPCRWVSLRAVRYLARLSLSSHVVLRCVAADLLQAVSLPVTVREPTWTVCAVPGALAVPASFLLPPDAAKELLSETEQRAHEAAVTAAQDCVQRLTEACPLMPYYVGTKGLVLPLSYLTVPRCAASALGLHPVQPGSEATSIHCSAITGAAFVDAITYTQPPDAAAYRLQWLATLLGGMNGGGGGVTVVDAEEESCQAADATARQLSPHSWVLRLLALPVECSQVHYDRQVASPTTVVKLLASLPQEPAANDASSPFSSAASLLLEWADNALRTWRRRRGKTHQPRGGDEQRTCAADTDDCDGPSVSSSERGVADTPPTHLTGGEGDAQGHAGKHDAKEGASEVEEDEMYRLFRSLAIVSSAVLRLTAPLRPTAAPSSAHKGPTDAELRTRAVHFFSDVVACVCSHAAVPHSVAQRVMAVAFTTLGESLTSEEVWMVVYALVGQLGSTTHAETATAAADDARSSGGDTWSQRRQRLLSFIGALFCGVPPAVIGANLPRLVALIEAHAQVFSFSSADQVRQMAAMAVAQLIGFTALQSNLRVEFNGCRTAADALMVSLMQRANTTVFHGRLPLVCLGSESEDSLSKASSATRAAAAISSGEAPESAGVGSPTSQDAALLTFTALCLQQSPADMLEAHARDMVLLLCCCLDLSFTEVQHLHEAVEAALASLVALRMSKARVHELIEQLCSVCTGSVAYGTSRRAKVACTRALRRLIFPNLHRIGRFAVMEQVAAASLAALAHRDAGIRAEGSHLLAVLTKVAAEAQTRVLVQRLVQELRQLPRETAAAASAASEHQREDAPSSSGVGAVSVGRRVALVQALGAVVLADPGEPSSYVPKVMVQLAGCAREGNTECGRVAKRVFEEWWHAHREGWEHVYKSRFTPAEVDAMSDLLLAPRYYA
ncbi:conserved hypothetical protein [Leishmania infantum JPCM5]|uniref:Domain_of_uncharacterized_function_(DUF3437)_-_pu tative n=2 Tax=Leishmania infantum TaxID=5671 RepID=A0A6L0WIL4_LEIIN|nr:conserved hypothetical protein [Leishmania infantum JPCM5]CAC9449491.1 Domain_of_uncharacterised_function_(DUF3437)_-_putative [Leishmania infantum]CAM65666.2 conserved hypothetical protein [Leishmania infantum JPCM5]SUZ39289.1 Domain_of_uncharacterised_function_(DUF3437)_-_putative [Leishmania infantum]|eukprot:XP_001463309.2 conserved hypothetical protein [Leishmania infantum JPCM5]